MTDLVQVKSGVLGDRTEMPDLVENELGYRKDEKALYIGTSSGNVRLCGADDIGGGGGAEELNAIGDAIRDITGGTEFIPVADMPEKVYEVYEQGQAEGAEVGKQEAKNTFWNAITQNGLRASGDSMFRGWAVTEECMKPPSTIMFRGISRYAFYEATVTEPLDIQAIEEELGYPVFDTSESIRLDYFNNPGVFSTLGTIDITGCTNASTLYWMFATTAATNYLTSIKKLIVSAGTYFTSSLMFRNCSNLKHCVFEGSIGTSGLDMSPCTSLDKESLTSIVNCLSTTTSGLSVTVSKTAVNKAFETSSGASNGSTSAEWTTLKATKSNWTINET